MVILTMRNWQFTQHRYFVQDIVQKLTCQNGCKEKTQQNETIHCSFLVYSRPYSVLNPGSNKLQTISKLLIKNCIWQLQWIVASL